jgi:hypothetical protein
MNWCCATMASFEKEQIVRVLLCDAKTGLFYRPPDQWTQEPELAENFRTSYKAALFAQEHGLGSAEVLLDFSDPEYNVRLPIGARLGLNYPVDEISLELKSQERV